MHSHLKKLQTAEITLESYNCQIEGCNFVTKCKTKMLSHLSTIHVQDKNFTSPCLYTTQCFHKENFKTVSGLKQHLRRFHPTFFAVASNVIERNSNGTHSEQGDIESIVNSDNIDSTEKLDVPTNTGHDVGSKLLPQIDLGLSSANFVLKLLTEQKLTQVNIQYIMTAGTELLNNAIKANLQEAIRLIVENKLDPMSALSSLLDCKETPFAQLKHQSTQNKYFVKHFGMIEPVNIVLPIQAVDFGRHKTGKDQHFKPKKYIYVPILKQLERILNFEDVYSAVTSASSLSQTIV